MWRASRAHHRSSTPPASVPAAWISRVTRGIHCSGSGSPTAPSQRRAAAAPIGGEGGEWHGRAPLYVIVVQPWNRAKRSCKGPIRTSPAEYSRPGCQTGRAELRRGSNSTTATPPRRWTGTRSPGDRLSADMCAGEAPGWRRASRGG